MGRGELLGWGEEREGVCGVMRMWVDGDVGYWAMAQSIPKIHINPNPYQYWRGAAQCCRCFFGFVGVELS